MSDCMPKRSWGKRGAALIWLMLRLCNNRLERQESALALLRDRHAAVGEEAVADDLGLLFEAITVEPATLLYLIAVAAERVTHQRQIEAAVSLRLPDMGHFVDEQTLQSERFRREIVRPARIGGVKVNITGRGHDDPLGLERPPAAADDPHPVIVDRRAEHRPGERDFSLGEVSTVAHRNPG